MYCMKCGKEIDKGAKFCVACGTPVSEMESKVKANEETKKVEPKQEKNVKKEENKTEVVKQNAQNNVSQNNNSNNNANNYNNNNSFNPNNIPYEYRPISMWGYFGYQILFAIPCIGFILLLIFAFGGTANKNLRNFAASYFCFFILLAILIFILVACGALGAGLMYTDILSSF